MSVENALYNLCQIAIEYGMSPKQFWENDLSVFYMYGKDYERKCNHERKCLDWLAWRIGDYMNGSLRSGCIPITIPSSKREIKEVCVSYPERPLTFQEKPKEEKKKSFKPPNPMEIAEYNAKKNLILNK